MDTELLYYKNPELMETDAKIISVSGSETAPLVALDRTVFFPGGGGQPADRGTLAGVEVSGFAEDAGDVVAKGGQIHHKLAAPLPAGTGPGSMVRICIDPVWRRDYSERHTAQHLLSSTMLRLFNAPTRSVHHGPEFSTIDFDIPALLPEDALFCEREVNRIISDKFSVIIHLCPPEDINAFNLRRIPPKNGGVVRVVEIDGIDFTPCCGLHAPDTAYIRLLKIIGIEKYKGLTRVSFTAGETAIGNYEKVFREAQSSAANLGVAIDGISAESARLLAKNRELEADRLAVLRGWARREAALAIEKAGNEAEPVSAVSASDEPEFAELVAKEIAEKGRIGMCSDPLCHTVHVAASDAKAQLGIHLGPIGRECEGKGGGGPVLFRISFKKKENMDAFIEKAVFELSKL